MQIKYIYKLDYTTEAIKIRFLKFCIRICLPAEELLLCPATQKAFYEPKVQVPSTISVPFYFKCKELRKDNSMDTI